MEEFELILQDILVSFPPDRVARNLLYPAPESEGLEVVDGSELLFQKEWHDLDSNAVLEGLRYSIYFDGHRIAAVLPAYLTEFVKQVKKNGPFVDSYLDYILEITNVNRHGRTCFELCDADQRRMVAKVLLFCVVKLSSPDFCMYDQRPVRELALVSLQWTQLRLATVPGLEEHKQLVARICDEFANVPPPPEAEIDKGSDNSREADDLLAALLRSPESPTALPEGLPKSYVFVLSPASWYFLLRAKLIQLVDYFGGKPLSGDVEYEVYLFIEVLSPREAYAWEEEPGKLASLMSRSQRDCLRDCLQFAASVGFGSRPLQ